MAKAKRKPKAPRAAKAPLMPRSGPPTNVRPGGPHAPAAAKRRAAAIERALREQALDDDAL